MKSLVTYLEGIDGITYLKTTGVGDLIFKARWSVSISRIPSACQHEFGYDSSSVPKSCPNEMRNAVDRGMHTVVRGTSALANPSCSSNDMIKRQLSMLWVPKSTEIRGCKFFRASREILSTKVLAHSLKEASVSAFVRYTGGSTSGEIETREFRTASCSWYAPRTNLIPSA